jgi:hypothetical protein
MSITLDESGLLLALDLEVGDDLCGPFELDRVMPHHEGGLLLSWSERGGRRTLGLQVRLRDDSRPAWKRTSSLDVITHLPQEDGSGLWLSAFAELVSRLASHDDGPDSIQAPQVAPGAPKPRRVHLPGARRTAALSPFDFGRVFVLDLDSDCHQRCTFCSTRAKWSPAQVFGGATLEHIESGLHSAYGDGYRVLRLSGLDPLTHPHVLDAVRVAAALGFEDLHIYSPSTRYAEPAFLAELLEASEGLSRSFHVPVYGASAEVHDAMTGLPGSFERVTRGLEALEERGHGAQIVLLAVLTRQGLSTWTELVDHLSGGTAPLQVFLPFPSTRSRDDAFFDVATTHEEAVRALAAAGSPPQGLAEVLPCVRYRFERETGESTLTRGPFHPVTALLGTLFEHADYRRLDDGPGELFTIPTVACPHHDSCALASLCPRGVYRAYEERFGLAELQPVSQEELSALGFEL